MKMSKTEFDGLVALIESMDFDVSVRKREDGRGYVIGVGKA